MPQWFSGLADALSILAFLAAVYAGIQSRKTNRDQAREKMRLTKVIRIVLSNGVRAIEPPGILRRSEFDRAEVLGRIGMIPTKNPKERFRIDFLNTEDFIRMVNDITDAKGDSILTIPITDAEFEQFVVQA
jgi:hypothetical protein